MPIIIKYASIVIPEPLSPARRKIGDGRQPAVTAEEGKGHHHAGGRCPIRIPGEKTPIS